MSILGARASVKEVTSDGWRTMRYNQLGMQQFQWVSLLVVGALLVGCETTQTAGQGNQEVKRLAQIQREQQEDAQDDESDINLWDAHQDMLSKGAKPAIAYTPLAQH